MRPAAEWRERLRGVTVPSELERVATRENDFTLRFRGVFLHSRYNPREEATRLIDSAALDPARPVLVLGLGLGYHVAELCARGFEVAVLEPEPAVARFAFEGPVASTEFLLGVGALEDATSGEVFAAFAARAPQVFVHPPTARLNPEYVEIAQARITQMALSGRRLSIAVVGPMYGGSLPIAGYLERAFRKLGHRVLYVDHSPAYALYAQMDKGIRSRKAVEQLGAMLLNVLSQSTYAQVAEFAPEVCIVLAQAPVGPEFPGRLAKDGILTAYWYVENWRHMPYWRTVAPQYDAFFHIQPGEFERLLDETGCRHHAHIPTGCDPEVHRPVALTDDERVRYGCDVSFAGAGYYNRNLMLAGLTDFDLKIWGVEWTARELQPFVQKPGERFGAEDFARIAVASKINLNLHSSTSHPGIDPESDAVNPRVFEAAACGGFQLCDPCRGLERFFDFETELPVYRSLEELREKIRYYLAHPDERKRIAQRARERALREHTYVHRAQAMIEFLIERHGARMLAKGVRVQRPMTEMAERVGRDTELGAYLSTLPPDEVFVLDNIAPHLPAICQERTRPQAIFGYLTELFQTTNQLIARKGR